MNDTDIKNLVEKAKENGGYSPRMSEAFGAYASVALRHVQAGTVMKLEEGIRAAVEAAMKVPLLHEENMAARKSMTGRPTTVAELTLEQRLLAAVWMVGNVDTPEDKAAWWHTFGDLWTEVSTDGKNAQAYADLMSAPGAPLVRLAPPPEDDSERWHWIETPEGMMAASWSPTGVGSWDIGGEVTDADDASAHRDWRYAGLAVPPAGTS